jgi:DNA-binding protein H-NS
MAKLTDLLAQKAALERKIAEARRAERADAIEQVRALMARYGLTLADLAPKRRSAGATTAPAAEPAAPARRASRKGQPLGKVAPKYRDPETGRTWSGRGLQPRWLSAALAAGRPIDAFRIAAPQEATAAADPAADLARATGAPAP